jgi:DNA invertase Pin-like site-specific DNA recombinase
MNPLPCTSACCSEARGYRPPLSPDQQQQLAADMARGRIPITTIASTLGCSRHTVYKALAQMSMVVE